MQRLWNTNAYSVIISSLPSSQMNNTDIKHCKKDNKLNHSSSSKTDYIGEILQIQITKEKSLHFSN